MMSRQHLSFMESSSFSLLVLLLGTLVGQCSPASTPCPPGQELRGRSCAATDICLSHSCPHGSSCRANNGSTTCYCEKGFRLCMTRQNCTSGHPYCRDVNECKEMRQTCGTGATCVNTIGSYCCIFNTANGTDIRTKCSECERNCYFSNSNSRLSDQMCMSICQMEALYKNMSEVTSPSEQGNKGTRYLDNEETILRSLVEVPSEQREERKTMLLSEIVIRRQIHPEEPFVISAMGNSMQVDSAVFTDTASGLGRRIPAVALIVHRNMTNILGSNAKVQKDAAKPAQQRMVLNSAVITAVTNSKLKTFRTHAVTFTFTHTKANEDKSNITCVYWNRTAKGSFWSPEGCELVFSNRTHTVCRAFHLSSFAILMALKDLPDVFEVEVITYVGLSISLVCLLLTIATFATCHSVKDTRRIIHINLCLSLFVADFVFLVGISQTGNRILCGIVAAILHYSFLSVFAWMFLEGIQLYLMVQVVFAPKVPIERFIYWIGYGFPALIVAISAAAYHEGYGTNTSCWLKTDKCFACSFFVPALVISIVNFIFLCKTLMRLKVELSKIIADKKRLGRHRAFTLTAIGQLVILGCTWILGAFYIQKATIPMMYIFTILNSFQGMFIFIMHCLMYKKVRDAYCRCFGKCLRQSDMWTPVSTSSLRTLNQGRRSVQETESTTSGTVQ
ncbi:adhesion G protein-coupled receptor E3-like isoform X1 [Carcharodon carcharias]|uniref:adhesion G protein-coupled receptor E3-like isoform X1 n=2 Tax=Carcharodon carcharias TaxID=13397 RepID=UPI001B7E560C|nr:adhesion G protein-coupled receptor E3-like isoform X1 [Carcharodon carcharias]